jgi:hypothetical protein
VLAELPSQWRGNGTIYDDFAILHGSIGSWGTRKLWQAGNARAYEGI